LKKDKETGLPHVCQSCAGTKVAFDHTFSDTGPIWTYESSTASHVAGLNVILYETTDLSITP